MINIIMKLSEMGYREITASPDLFVIKDIESGAIARFKYWQQKWEDMTDEEVVEFIEIELLDRARKKR